MAKSRHLPELCPKANTNGKKAIWTHRSFTKRWSKRRKERWHWTRRYQSFTPKETSHSICEWCSRRGKSKLWRGSSGRKSGSKRSKNCAPIKKHRPLEMLMVPPPHLKVKVRRLMRLRMFSKKSRHLARKLCSAPQLARNKAKREASASRQAKMTRMTWISRSPITTRRTSWSRIASAFTTQTDG